MFAVFPVVAMPEGTVDENDQLGFFQTDIRLAWKMLFGCFVADARTPQSFLEKHFRLGSLGANLGHIIRALFGRIEPVGFTKLSYRYFGYYVRLILQRIG